LKDENGIVRYLAVRALGDLGNKRAVEALIYAFGDDYEYVQWKASEALGDIGEKRATGP